MVKVHLTTQYIQIDLELNILQKKFKNLWWTKKIITNIYRIQAHDTIMCEYFYIGFTDFMSKDKILLDCTKLFSANGYEKNDKIILKYFQ